MNLSEAAHEALERYWIENKERGQRWGLPAASPDSSAPESLAASELAEGGLAALGPVAGQGLELTAKGWEEARRCVRRHRLAERLLADVLDVKKETIHAWGCKFEHVLQDGVEESICTLLGHPSSCPHGKSIPPGSCCAEGRSHARRLVLPLSECEPGDAGRIAFVKTPDAGGMDKLTAMGILPGQAVKLLKKTPAHLVQLGESQFAMDKGLAGRIHVRLGRGEGK